MKVTWETIPLSSVLTERTEKPSENDLANGSIRIISKIAFNDGKIQLREDSKTKTGMILVYPGDLVVSGINAAKGAIAIYGDDNIGPIAATIHYGAYIPNKKRVDIKFLWWLLRSNTFRDLLAKYVPGGIKTELKAKRLLPIPIPLPPLPEQQRIVASVEFLAAKIDEARSLHSQAFDGSEALIPIKIATILSDGEKDSLEKRTLGDYVLDCCYGTSVKTSDDNTGTPVLRMGNIQNGRLDTCDLKYYHFNHAEVSKLRLQKGDIVVNRTNSAELVGKCAVFDINDDFAFASYLIRLRLDTSRAEPKLVAAYINSPVGRSYMFRERKQMTGQANVNATKLKALPISLPPLNEQRRIMAYLDELQEKAESLKRLQAETAAELDALLPAILDKAFKGEP